MAKRSKRNSFITINQELRIEMTLQEWSYPSNKDKILFFLK
jgi:hypothetical protein